MPSLGRRAPVNSAFLNGCWRSTLGQRSHDKPWPARDRTDGNSKRRLLSSYLQRHFAVHEFRPNTHDSFSFVLFSADRDNGSAFPTGCVCVCVCVYVRLVYCGYSL